ncbi:MAG: saccharopine dehydrogenase NADP-binding domain-containing protein [Pyrinomonadaceae bacterium]|nr:saccharopine dehydrogenase NADP-binding domain-containing protein [Pyrinomonadaceae bacterium]
MTSNRTVTVFGAYGHTGRFVVAELRRRGWTPILSGRDSDKLNVIGAAHRGLDIRPASIDDPSSLDRALAGAAAVINCAGPFARTSAPVIEAALRSQIPYLDVAAEIEVVAATFEQYADVAREAGIVIVPSMAFYGGLGDLLATAAMGDWPAADEICIAYGLSSWKPTLGTRATTQVSKQRRDGRRIVFSNRRMEFRTDDAPILDWTFPAPIGMQAVVSEFTMADSVTIPSHLSTPEIRSYMTVAAVKDLSDPDLSPPAAADESGRSSQTFLVEVVARSGSAERRAAASGRDIYAITAPLVVEATERVVSGRANKTGVVAAGEAFDARDFLRSLSPEHLSLEIQ